MDRYPPIADHGLIGDLQTAALVTAEGVIDWFAAPRFDSPSVFASLLDHDRGGHFRFAPTSAEVTRRQLYYPDSAIVVTRRPANRPRSSRTATSCLTRFPATAMRGSTWPRVM